MDLHTFEVENLLLDSNYTFKALETVAGNEKLQFPILSKIGINSSSV